MIPEVLKVLDLIFVMKVNLIRMFQVIAKFTSSGKDKVKYQGQN